MGPIVYECEIKEPWYSQVMSGRKTVEGRLNRDKWSNMEKGDLLYIKNPATPGIKVAFEIVDVEYCEDFYELHFTYGKSLLPDIDEYDHNAAVEVYRDIYTDDMVKKYGVVGIVLKRYVG